MRLPVRGLTYAVVATLVAGALYLTPQLPQTRPAADVLRAAPSPTAPLFPLRQDTLGRGESLRAALARGGVSGWVADQALLAARSLDPRRIPAGMPITVRAEHPDSTPTEITLQLAIDRVLRLKRQGATWTETDERLPWTTDTVVVGGEIASTLYDAMDASARTLLPAGARMQLTWSLADIFEYKVDMSRDLQAGDRFRVMAERSVSPNGAVKIGRIVAATLELSGSTLEAVRFRSAGASGEYFDQDGKSLRAAFLRAPLEFRRISSVFGMRHHPILGVWKFHKGTDYAASSGTPVRAIGDGTVVKAGWGNGYGNVLEIRHRNGFVTRYGHLRGFARGVRAGAHVGIGQTVAFVGTTGLSTAPHLHFEVLVNGAQRDPRSALRNKSGDPVPANERADFVRVREEMIAALDQPNGPTRLASR